MVKKASILRRLKGRFLSGSGVRVDGERSVEPSGKPKNRVASASKADKAPAGRNRLADAAEVIPPVEAVEAPLPARPTAERVSGRKMSSKEQAVVAVGESFQELAGLVRGVERRIDDQGQRSQKAADDIAKLPALGNAQLELLRQMAGHFEQQNEVGKALLKSVGDLPSVLQGVRTALERAAATDERSSKTLGEFRSTMDRIDTSMGKMIEHSKQSGEALVREQQQANQRITQSLASGAKIDTKALEESVDGLRSSNEDASRRLEKSSSEGIDALRRAQEDQANRLNKLIASNGNWNKAVVVLLTLAVAALGGLLFVLATR